MTALAAPARIWPLADRPPLLDAWPEDGRDWMLDLSALPRFVLRGPGSTAWLSGRGCPLPDTIHRTAEAPGMTVVRLGGDEVILLADPLAGPTGLAALRQDWQQAAGPKGFDAWREETWCWLALTGPGLADALPLLTAVDTRPHVFGPGAVVQTRALHMDAVLVRNDRNGQPGLDMLFDVASSDYAADFVADVLPGFQMGRLAG